MKISDLRRNGTMIHKLHVRLVAQAVFAILCLAASARAQDIRWAGVVNPSSSERENILHAPDNRITPVDPPLVVSGFLPGVRGPLDTASNLYPSTMHYSGLARLLGVSERILARADVIAFEGNGGGFGTWESSEWTFSDGVNVRRVSYDYRVGPFPNPGGDPAVIATGDIDNTAYSAFFGMCAASRDGAKMSYILFDLDSTAPVINARSQGFSITLANGTGAGGSPDPDAIGVFASCRTK
jgi:hypothetical protein